MIRYLAAILFVLSGAPLAIAADAPLQPGTDGIKTFVARPKVGAAVFELPSTVRWRSAPAPGGGYQVMLTADINASTVLANVPRLSAGALNRDKACDHLVRVKSASAKLTGPRSLIYDVRFHYAKRLCVGMPLEYPADISCRAKIAVAAERSLVTIDVQGATNPACSIDGLSPALSDSITAQMSASIFKRHAVDAARLLPKEFQGIPIDIQSVAIDLPPAAPILHVTGETKLNEPQYQAFLTRIAPLGARFVRYWPGYVRH